MSVEIKPPVLLAPCVAGGMDIRGNVVLPSGKDGAIRVASYHVFVLGWEENGYVRCCCPPSD